MSQVTGALNINNGAATPVAKSFAPEQVTPALTTFTERSAASSVGFLRLGVGFSAANSRRPTNRVNVDFDMPVMQVSMVSTRSHILVASGVILLSRIR